MIEGVGIRFERKRIHAAFLIVRAIYLGCINCKRRELSESSNGISPPFACRIITDGMLSGRSCSNLSATEGIFQRYRKGIGKNA